MKQIATVVNNYQPDWQNIIETEPNVTLAVGTRLFLATPFAELGAPLGGGFFAGEMIINGEYYALIVAPKASGEKMRLTYKNSSTGDGTTSDEDGVANSSMINDADHPAAQFCQSLEIGGHPDWYLPSRDELAQLWRNLGPKRKNTPEAFREGGAESFETEWYWSSTEAASYPDLAWSVNFTYGYQNYDDKDYGAGVRAVRRLKI